MINFRKYILENGLRILVNEDSSTPLVAMNIIYDVGSRDEDPDLTGMAHLFEHMMFGGSLNVPDFDTPLQMAGAENNAFTNNDFTNYYLTIPANNLETGFWLESDRMLSLSFSKEVLNIQKKVVIEEFKQRYLNQPYGDLMLLFRPLAYKVHPYLWSTIGKDISHIEKVTLSDAKDFFFSHYAPNNAILSVSGNVNSEEVIRLAKKWFEPINKREISSRRLAAEPVQTEKRKLTVERDVPSDIIYMAWHICPRGDRNFNILDVLTDILAGGESGRLYSSLVRDKKLFTDINAYLTGEIDPGLLIINGKLMDGISFDAAEVAINGIIEGLQKVPVPTLEMEKVRNKFEASMVFSNSSVQNKAMNLGFYELLGDANSVNNELKLYFSVVPEKVMEAASNYIVPANCSTLLYKSLKTGKKQ
jgi:predicted Zn-dependent peptidase